MEIAQLKNVSRHCPAGTLPFFHSFGSRFQCVPIETSGLNGLGTHGTHHMCPGGTPPVQFGGKFVCFQSLPAGFSGVGLSPLVKWGLGILAGVVGLYAWRKYR